MRIYRLNTGQVKAVFCYFKLFNFLGPRTSVRVCVRNTSTIKDFDWCSAEISKGDPGPAEVLIPGSIMYDFEVLYLLNTQKNHIF
jgi:hypothetical protein